MGSANDAIESLVAQHEPFGGMTRLEPLAAALAFLASRLEEVSIVGVHGDLDRERELYVSVVMNSNALVARAVPEKSRAAQMERASRHKAVTIRGEVGVG